MCDAEPSECCVTLRSGLEAHLVTGGLDVARADLVVRGVAVVDDLLDAVPANVDRRGRDERGAVVELLVNGGRFALQERDRELRSGSSLNLLSSSSSSSCNPELAGLARKAEQVKEVFRQALHMEPAEERQAYMQVRGLA